MSPRLILPFAILLAGCGSSATVSSSEVSCDDFLNQEGLGAVTFTVQNQRAEPMTLPSECCNERPPLMEVTFGSESEAPIFPPGGCANTCEEGMPDGNGWGCTIEQLFFRYIEPGEAVSFTWPGIYVAGAALPDHCALTSDYAGACNVERPVPAGELTFTLHLLSNVDPSLATDCVDGLCFIEEADSLFGDAETLTTSLTFDAAGAQTHAVTID